MVQRTVPIPSWFTLPVLIAVAACSASDTEGVLAVLLGDPIGIGEIVLPLLGAFGLGALVGGAFAGGVAALGRTEAVPQPPAASGFGR